MKARCFRKVLSIMLAALMIMPLIMLTPEKANAQSDAVNITIVNVTRRYRDSASYLKLCNDYRSENELDPWVMDDELYELAMKKAAELAVYVDEYNLDGSYFLNNTEEERGLMIGYGVSSSAVLFNSFKSDAKYVSYLLSEKYKSAGVGSVEVDGKKYVCVLLSGKDPVPVDSSVLTQINKRLPQKTQCNPAYLTDNRINFKDDAQVVCGKEFSINLVVHNMKYDDANTVVTSDDMELSSSDTSVFKPTGSGTLIGTGPGTALITMKLGGTQGINASVRLKSVAYDINTCKFTAIPDQSYSGTEVRPAVSLLTSTNVSLVEGKDYELTYYNNTEVGQAQVTITGIGSYSGSSRTEKFNIISDPNAFGVTLRSDVSEIELGQSAGLTASFVNGKEPVSFKYEYALQGSSAYEMICEESTDHSCSFKPSAAGTYVLRVTAADAENKIAAANVLLGVSTPLSVALNLDVSDLIIGDTLNVSSIAEGGKTPYKYAYYILEPEKTEYRLIASYGDLTALTYTPTALGEYRIRCDVKGSNDLTATVSESFTVSPEPLVNDSTVSSMSVKTGKEITMNAQASGGIEPYSYAYSYKEISSDEWTMIAGGNDGGYVTKTSEIFSQSEAGTYVLRVSVKDSDNKIVDKDFTVTVFEDPLRNDSSISADSAGNSVGITISGKAGGGEEPYRYAYYYKETSSGTWTKLAEKDGSAYVTETSVLFKPSDAGTYDLRVNVKDSKNNIVKKDFSVTIKDDNPLKNDSTISAESAGLDTGITISGQAVGGKEPYRYAYYYKETSSGTWTKLAEKDGSAYVTETSVLFKPSDAGTYDLRVNVRDSKNSLVQKNFTVTIKDDDPLKNESTISSESAGLDTGITISGQASGGTEPYRYAYYYKNTSSGTWTKLAEKDGSAYVTETSVLFKPSDAGVYDLRVNVKDSKNSLVQKNFTVTIKDDDPLKNDSTISADSAGMDMGITISGKASGGTEPYRYAYYYKKISSATWTKLAEKDNSAYVTETNVLFKPSDAGTYDLRVNVKDSTDKKIQKNFIVTIQ